MRVWIDLANSPHALIFAPVARRLEALGAEVMVTARDHAQTVELARERWGAVAVIGEPSPPGALAKGRAIAARVGKLARWARRARPDVALSHNSYAQLLAASALRIPSVTAMDYEHQAANHLAFRSATRVLLPEVVPGEAVRRQGASPRKVTRYAGLKEELYLGDFEPDPEVLSRVGLERRNGMSLVVARAGPAGALYHRSENQFFFELLRAIGARPSVGCVVLTRTAAQRERVDRLGLAGCVTPDSAVDARSLMWQADLFVGAGGTMTREAALLGVPTYSVFAGPPPAVDRLLQERGLMRAVHSIDQAGEIEPRSAERPDREALRERGREIEDVFVQATVAASRRPANG